MAKKGGQAQLIVDIDNDEDWEKLVEKDGLILVDVYSDWCGPCSGMAGNLRKAKLEFGGETLSLATAKADNITCLERFRDKSEPTWMFIYSRKVVRLIFGTNAPKLMRILEDEVRKTKLAMESTFPRDGLEFDELTDEEQAKVDEETAAREEAERTEREARERAIIERREEIVNNLLEPLKEYNFIVVWPHINNHEKMAQITNLMKETIMSSVGKPSKVRITEEDLFDMFYYSNWKFNEIELRELTKDDCTCLLYQAPATEVDIDTIEFFRQKIYGVMERPPGDDDSIAVRLSKSIKVEREALRDHADVYSHIEDDPEIQRRASGEDPPPDKFMEVAIPAMYVPENEKSKCMAMRRLFPHVTIKFDIPEAEPIPPHLIVVFDTFKKNEAMQVAADFKGGVMQYGFFTSADPAKAKLVAKTVAQYDRMMSAMDTKLVLQVSKKKSEPLLSFAVLGPVYVSPNTVIGEIQSAQFFPENYELEEVVITEAPVKSVAPAIKKRKKKKPRKPSLEPEGEVSEEVAEGEEVAESEEVEGEEEDDDEGDETDEDPDVTDNATSTEPE